MQKIKLYRDMLVRYKTFDQAVYRLMEDVAEGDERVSAYSLIQDTYCDLFVSKITPFWCQTGEYLDNDYTARVEVIYWHKERQKIYAEVRVSITGDGHWPLVNFEGWEFNNAQNSRCKEVG